MIPIVPLSGYWFYSPSVAWIPTTSAVIDHSPTVLLRYSKARFKSKLIGSGCIQWLALSRRTRGTILQIYETVWAFSLCGCVVTATLFWSELCPADLSIRPGTCPEYPPAQLHIRAATCYARLAPQRLFVTLLSWSEASLTHSVALLQFLNSQFFFSSAALFCPRGSSHYPHTAAFAVAKWSEGMSTCKTCL